MEKTIITTCTLDCSANCGMIEVVKNGCLLRLEGKPDHGYTQGYLCKKGYDYVKRVYSDTGVLFPQKKVGDGWKRIGWDEALDAIADRIRFFLKTYEKGLIAFFQRTSSWGRRSNWSSGSSISCAA